MIEFKVKINSDIPISRENLTHIMKNSIEIYDKLYKDDKNIDDILSDESENGDYKFRYSYVALKMNSFETTTCQVDIIEDELFSMLQVCEIIKGRDDIDLKLSRIKMFEYLRSFGILNQNNIPNEEYLITGNYFSVKKDVVMGKSYPTTYVTKKGIDFIVSVFKSRNIIL